MLSMWNKVQNENDLEKGYNCIDTIREEIIIDIITGKDYDFTDFSPKDNSFWAGKGITIQDETDQCVIHLPTNFIFRKNGVMIGRIDEFLFVHPVEELTSQQIEWLRHHQIQTDCNI